MITITRILIYLSLVNGILGPLKYDHKKCLIILTVIILPCYIKLLSLYLKAYEKRFKFWQISKKWTKTKQAIVLKQRALQRFCFLTLAENDNKVCIFTGLKKSCSIKISPGYSQSRSSPSKLCFWSIWMTLSIKFWRSPGSFDISEYAVEPEIS